MKSISSIDFAMKVIVNTLLICSSLLFSASFRIFYSKAKRFHKKEFQANILNIPTTCIVVQRLEWVITHIPTKDLYYNPHNHNLFSFITKIDRNKVFDI